MNIQERVEWIKTYLRELDPKQCLRCFSWQDWGGMNNSMCLAALIGKTVRDGGMEISDLKHPHITDIHESKQVPLLTELCFTDIPDVKIISFRTCVFPTQMIEALDTLFMPTEAERP